MKAPDRIAIAPISAQKAEEFSSRLNAARPIIADGLLDYLDAQAAMKHKSAKPELAGSRQKLKGARDDSQARELFASAFRTAQEIVQARAEGQQDIAHAIQAKVEGVKRNIARVESPLIQEQLSDMFDALLLMATSETPMSYPVAQRAVLETAPEQKPKYHPTIM